MQKSSSRAEQIKALKNGRGIQYLLNKAYEICGNPILIHDMEYKLVGYSENVTTDDPIWNEYIAKGTVGPEWLEFFKNECFLEEAANAKTITFLTSDKLEYNRIFGKVFNKNGIQVGCAVMTASDEPFEDDDPMAFEDMCAILSKELGKDAAFNDYGQAYFEKLVDELIAEVSDFALYTAHVESIYMHLKANIYLGVVDVRKCDPTGTQLPYFRDLLKKTQPEYSYAVYADYVLIIISEDAPILHIDKHLSKLNRLFVKKDLYAGISRSFDNLFDLSKHYKEALSALNSGLETGGQHISQFEG